MAKIIQKNNPPSLTKHLYSDCPCLKNWLIARKLTLLSFFHSTNETMEKLYYEMLTNEQICFNNNEGTAISVFVKKRGENYARRGANDPIPTEQNPIININIPKKDDYKNLPNKKIITKKG